MLTTVAEPLKCPRRRIIPLFPELAARTHSTFQGLNLFHTVFVVPLVESGKAPTAEQPVPRCRRIKAGSGQPLLNASNPQPSFFPDFNSGRRGHFPHNNSLCNVLHTNRARGPERAGAVCQAFKGEADPLHDKTLFRPVSLKRGATREV